MTVEIIAVGTEILLGDIENTHAQFISKKLAELGMDVHHHSSVGDNIERLSEAFKIALGRSDIVIASGGLGPTDDDITKEAVCELLDIPLVHNEEAEEKIREFFKRRELEMSENNLKQALFPKDAVVLKNEMGTACGVIIDAGAKKVILLPGPPNELVPMFEKEVYPYLLEQCDHTIKSTTLRVACVGESKVAELLGDLVTSNAPTVALYAKSAEVEIRITSKAISLEAAEEEIKPMIVRIRRILGDSVYDNSSLESEVVEKLSEQGLKVAIAESCTGGLVSKKITSVSGASKVFEFGISSYSNRIKKQMLNVDKSTLFNYSAESAHTAIQMAFGVMNKGGSDIGVGITGFAGPDGGNDTNPVGTVFIAVAKGDFVWVERHVFGHGIGDERETIRENASIYALDMVRQVLLESPKAFVSLKTRKKALRADETKIKDNSERPKYMAVYEMLIPKKGDRWEEVTRKSMILATIVTFIVCLVVMADYLMANYVSDQTTKMAQELYRQQPTMEQIRNMPYGYLDKFACLYDSNKDIIGWINVPNTNVDFPVVQSTNNSHYLYTDFFNRDNKNGVPFADYRNNFTQTGMLDFNTIIYAHNIRGGRFFSELTSYKDLDFYKQHTTINFDTVYKESKWKVVGMLITNADKADDNGEVFNYNNFFTAETDQEYLWYKTEIERRTIIKTNVDMQPSDRFLMLSTCTYDFNNARFVIVARRLREGEDENTPVIAEYNPNPLYPQAWYDKHGGTKPLFPPNPQPTGETSSEIMEEQEYDLIPFYEMMPSGKYTTFSDDGNANVYTPPPLQPNTGRYNPSQKPDESSRASSVHSVNSKKTPSSSKPQSSSSSSKPSSSSSSSPPVSAVPPEESDSED